MQTNSPTRQYCPGVTDSLRGFLVQIKKRQVSSRWTQSIPKGTCLCQPKEAGFQPEDAGFLQQSWAIPPADPNVCVPAAPTFQAPSPLLRAERVLSPPGTPWPIRGRQLQCHTTLWLVAATLGASQTSIVKKFNSYIVNKMMRLLIWDLMTRIAV